jgi:hypothetical protein
MGNLLLLFSRDAKHSAFAHCAGGENQAGPFRNGFRLDAFQQQSRLLPERIANDQNHPEAIESAKTMIAANWALRSVKKNRIPNAPSAINKNFVSTLKSAETPSFSSGGAPGTKPIQQDETRVGMEMKLLRLTVAGICEGLNRVRRDDQQRVSPQFRRKFMAARPV